MKIGAFFLDLADHEKISFTTVLDLFAPKSREIIDFYREKKPDNRGVVLDKIIGEKKDSWKDKELELDTHYIEWIFPLPRENAPFNAKGPFLEKEAIRIFRNDSKVKRNFIRSFERMLRFYGLKWDNSIITPKSEFSTCDDPWLHTPKESNTHSNFYRITRMIQSLRILGFPEQAKALFNIFFDIYQGEGSETISLDTFHNELSSLISEGHSQDLPFQSLPLEIQSLCHTFTWGFPLDKLDKSLEELNNFLSALPREGIHAIASPLAVLSQACKSYYRVFQPMVRKLEALYYDRSPHKAMLDLPKGKRLKERKIALHRWISAFGGKGKFHSYPILNLDISIVSSNSLSPRIFIKRKFPFIFGIDSGNHPYFLVLLKWRKQAPTFADLDSEQKQKLETSKRIGFVAQFYQALSDWELWVAFTKFTIPDFCVETLYKTHQIVKNSHPDLVLGDPQAVTAYYDAHPEEL